MKNISLSPDSIVIDHYEDDYRDYDEDERDTLLVREVEALLDSES